mmetsp:Transcript_6939/g.9563  ORF Transcript_6939/g.9563 Transcript_6939/m.9563 type:complete len:329 (-) Transcript_6939:269-1255(-)|eukprot:CAMPEP_0185266842 /NCGR_PEP_ID=MMETSP1359-20130426/32484_1 /TAXON_ID=552665 /ORGANISM="Bigelowiella longifila, Strain CCMP242" /LENGTH=328 /DNA_ID=CAMNT_0027856877 /DNA_START=19 /DNA_END=1005 /DNA_ORIENTATION=-
MSLVLLLLAVTGGAVAKKKANTASCEEITASDALFIVDLQNDFMEPFPVPNPEKQRPNYDISKHLDDDGKILAGSLPVDGSSEIVEPINTWISYFLKHGGKIFASLDWHKENHCSFCRNGTEASNPTGYKPHGGLCGPLPRQEFNDSGRCIDRVAKADYTRGSLMQWPDHCVMQRFGSRFQPFLRIPDNTVVVKKGWDPLRDTYSAFGGTESKEGYPFDLEDAMADLEGRNSLEELLTQHKIKRFWTVGLALDFCVGGTLLDALGANTDTQRPKPPTVGTAILIQPCTRAVSPSTTGKTYLEKIREAGGVITDKIDPESAIKDVCSRT